jgi:hypothetical protein
MTGWTATLRQSSRIPAFLIHLCISATLVGALGAAVYFLWYPPPYFEFDGGWNVMRVVLLVDVVLGPVLTLIVFRRGKPGLKRDLAIIGSLQLVAFVYGVQVLVEYRPVFAVYSDRNFFSVPWPDLAPHTRDHERVNRMRAEKGAALMVLELPPDPAERNRLRNAIATGGPRITVLGDYYQPFTSERWREILRDGIDIEAQLRVQPEIAPDVERFRARFLEGSGLTLEKLAFYPAVMRYGVVLFAFERDSGRLFGWVSE